MFDLARFRKTLEQSIEKTKENLSTIRTGRATSTLVENLPVTTYGGEATLKIVELATITSNGPQELLVTPFDPSVLQDIEKKLRDTSIGFSVSVDGGHIRAKVPPLTQEQREKYTKLVSEYTEEGREYIRRARDEVRKEIKMGFEEKTISEDEKFRDEAQVDKVNKEFNDKIEELRSRKEQEIMSI